MYEYKNKLILTKVVNMPQIHRISARSMLSSSDALLDTTKPHTPFLAIYVDVDNLHYTHVSP